MLLKLSNLVAIAVGAFLVAVALSIGRFVMLARNTPGNIAVDVYVLVHSAWLLLSFVAILAFAIWIGYRWVFKS